MEFIQGLRNVLLHLSGAVVHPEHSGVGSLLLCLGLWLAAGSARAVPAGYTLFWAEEFSGTIGSKPDATRWGYDLGAGGWGNNELQTYVNDITHAQVIEDAAAEGAKALRIRATKDSSTKYTSARIKTLGKVSIQYGYLEGRIRMPYGQGIWPAFWMLGTDFQNVGWPSCGEIDIMENVGKEPTITHSTLHGPGYSGGSGIGGGYTLPGGAQFKDAYHTFGVRWRPDAFTFSVDGTEYKTITSANIPSGSTWVFNKPFFFILNLAVGGNWPGYPDATTVFPQDYLIDYVRVYKFVPPYGHTVTLKSLYNNKYVTAGTAPLIADKTTAETAQQYQVINAGDGYVALKALANGLYVSADSTTSACIANKAVIGATEQFEWVDAGSGNIALKARSVSRYVCADNYGANPLIANRTNPGSWETFIVNIVSSPDPGVLTDSGSALSAAAGLIQPASFETGRLNVEASGDSAAVVDISDAVRLARRAFGMDTF